MRNKIATYSLLFGVGFGCAAITIPLLGVRPLWINKSKPGLYFRYCTDRTFFAKRCKEWKEDFYDMNDVAVREKLIAHGYICRPE